MKVKRHDEFKFKGVWFVAGEEIPKESEDNYSKHVSEKEKNSKKVNIKKPVIKKDMNKKGGE